MVKSGAPHTAAESLTQALRAGGDDLLRVRSLIQKTPLTASQLQDVALTVDHLLITPGEKLAVVSSDEGRAAAAYHKARPHWDITAWVPDVKTLLRAQGLQSDAAIHLDKQPSAKNPAGMKAIVAVAWAHQVFSKKHYSISALAHDVRDMIQHLADDGQLILQDVGLSDGTDRFVLLDIADAEASEALEIFAQTARASLPKAERGFFIEKLSKSRDPVQRFRLPYKWAAEFMQRWRFKIAPDAPFELTTLSLEQWAALVEQCGGRVLYRTPHAMPPAHVKELNHAMRLSDEHEQKLPLPPGSFTLVIEKIVEDKAASVYERRVANEATKTLRRAGAKDKIPNAVEVAQQEDDVLPWRRDEDGNLRVWVRTHVARPIVNTVPRGTPNLDGRHWAGYLIEPLAMLSADAKNGDEAIADFIHEQTRLPKVSIKNIRPGINYYPDANHVAQRVRGLFVHVTNSLPENKGDIVEVLADDVLRAISVGLIPDGKLEILISKLMLDLGVKPAQTGDMLSLIDVKPTAVKLHAQREGRTARFFARSGEKMNEHLVSEDEAPPRLVRSFFVEDHLGPFGRETRGGQERDFMLPGTMSANTAVCLPLIRDHVGQYVFAAEARQTPIPQRLGTDEPMLSLPSFRLPESLKTIDAVRGFLAKQFNVAIEDIIPLGPSFFLQPQISPERVYPFALRATGFAMIWERWFKPRGQLQKLIDPNVEKSTAFIEFKAARDLGQWYQGFTPDLNPEITARAQNPYGVAPQETTVSSNDNRHMTLYPR